MTDRLLLRTPAPAAGCIALLALLGMGTTHLAAQDVATVRVEENLRAEPQGVILGRLDPGRSYPVVSVQDRWVQVQVEGWIWTASLQSTDRPGFDLVVSAEPHENLRAEPQGEILGRMISGTLFEGLEEIPGWTRVRRVAWLWAESVELSGDVPAETGEMEAPATGQGSGAGAPSSGSGGEGWIRSGAGRLPILTGPDGDTLALAQPGTEVRVLAREGNWVRVRVDGWSWAPQGAGEDSLPTGAPITDATPQDVAGNPGDFRGRVVSWELQYVSLERAEPIRTDFYEGEPFLLTRTSSERGDFVYVAVPPDRLGEVEGLIPLERIRVVGRIRTGSAALTGNVVLDLLELTRISRE